MTLAKSSNGRIAGHLANGGRTVGDESRARAQASGRGSRLAASVATTDNDDVIGLGGHRDRAMVGAGGDGRTLAERADTVKAPCAAGRCGRLQRWPLKEVAWVAELATATENTTASKAQTSSPVFGW